jgi:hypothetical protein
MRTFPADFGGFCGALFCALRQKARLKANEMEFGSGARSSLHYDMRACQYKYCYIPKQSKEMGLKSMA